MAAGLTIEFEGVDKSHYDAVNKTLGIDSSTGAGDWPSGILSHAAGTTSDGGFIVFEVWESQEAQGQFMETRLGPALQGAGIAAPSRITWIDLLAHHTM